MRNKRSEQHRNSGITGDLDWSKSDVTDRQKPNRNGNVISNTPVDKDVSAVGKTDDEGMYWFRDSGESERCFSKSPLAFPKKGNEISMQIKPEHILYTDEQLANMTTLIVADDDPDAPTVVLNSETGQLIAVVRASTPEEDVTLLREFFDIVRIDWLGVLGYEEGRLFALEQDYEKEA